MDRLNFGDAGDVLLTVSHGNGASEHRSGRRLAHIAALKVGTMSAMAPIAKNIGPLAGYEAEASTASGGQAEHFVSNGNQLAGLTIDEV